MPESLAAEDTIRSERTCGGSAKSDPGRNDKPRSHVLFVKFSLEAQMFDLFDSAMI